jgi:hypothetical protein
MSDDVKIVKLVSGEELLCRVLNVSETIVEVDEAVMIVPQPGEPDPKTGQVKIGVGFLPWATLVDGAVPLFLDKIVFIAKPDDQVIVHHERMFGKRKIDVPNQNLILAR